MKETLLIIASAVALPLVLILLIAGMNHKKETRYEQTLYPFAALAYAVLCCVFLPQLIRIADSLRQLPIVEQLLNLINTKSAWVMGVDLFGIYLMNLLVMAGFLIVKGMLRAMQWSVGGIFHGIWRAIRHKGEKRHELPVYGELRGIRKLHWAYINLFYNIDRGEGTVRSRIVPVGKVYRYAANIITLMYLGLLVFCLLPLINGASWFPYDLMQNILAVLFVWPAVSLVFLKEVGFYLDGKTTEYAQEGDLIHTACPEKEHHADYTSMAHLYEKQFPERFVTCLQVPTFPVEMRATEAKSELAREIANRLKQEQLSSHTHISQAVMDCITDLPERENVLIDSVLSAELGDCLMLYMNVLLSKGENLLILCEDEDTCNEVKAYVTEKLTKINVFAPVWMVRSVSEACQTEDCDVLVVTPQTVLDERVQQAKPAFFKHLTMVMMINSARLISQMGGLLTLVSGKLARDRREPIQYICLCNGISGEMRVTLEQLLSPGRAFKPYECFQSDETNQIMLWNYEAVPTAENRLAQQNLFGEALDNAYLGVMMPFAFVAAKCDVQNICMIGKENPYAERMNTVRTYFSFMRQYFGDSFLLNELTDKLAFNMIETDNPFLIVTDDTYNLPMQLRNYCRQVGKETSMVHIISKPYMLRDYFSAHAAGYLKDRKKAEMFAPVLANTNRMLAGKMIADAASDEGLSLEKLRLCMQTIAPELKTESELLHACYSAACSGEKCADIDAVFSSEARNVYVPEKKVFERRQFIHLIDYRLFERVVGDIRPAMVQLNNRQISLGIGRKDIYRYYLPDQVIVADGCMHYIDAINVKDGTIICGRKIGATDLSTDYFQCRRYGLDLTCHEKTDEELFVDMRSSKVQEHVIAGYTTALLHNVKMDVETNGFFVTAPHSGMLDLTDCTGYRELSDRVKQEAFRHKENASVLSIRFHGVDPQLADYLSYTLSVLLGELMKTYFPYNWPCVAVCPVLHSDALLKGSVMRENLARLYPKANVVQDKVLADDEAQVLIIEDSESDTGILEAICRNRITPLVNTFSILRDYLTWQLQGETSYTVRGDYLFFGDHGVPDVLKLDLVNRMLHQLETVRPSGIVWVDDTANKDYCYFCHKDLRFTSYVQLLDEEGKRDRKVCNTCSKRLLSRKEELEPLYQRTRQYLTDTFGIELPRKIKVKFVSAATIRKQMNKNRSKGRVIGLAQKLKKTLWVETLSPEEFILSTLVHELTHFWQFENINMDDLTAVEGHASYVEVQFMNAEGFDYLARRHHNGFLQRDDEYGRGYVMLDEIMKKRQDRNIFTYMLERCGKKGVKRAPGNDAGAGPEGTVPTQPGGTIQTTGVELDNE